MAPGIGVKAPVPRTRTGCLTCRKRKVKCDELKPNCAKCQRLQRPCIWSEDATLNSNSPSRPSQYSLGATSRTGTVSLSRPSGQRFVVEFPNVNRATIPYIHHFITFCSRFLLYPNDSEGNPFQEELVPLAVQSPALLHAMAAVAAGHLSRGQNQHQFAAAKHYSMALRGLTSTLSDPACAKSDATLGACLLLCVYEISHSENGLWLRHLQGARDLILYRGGPKTTDYLSRFFSLLDVSGSLFAGGGPLLEGNYWLDDVLPNAPEGNKPRSTIPNWPAYDPEGDNENHFHILMTFMARMSRLSAEALAENADQNIIKVTAAEIGADLNRWWLSCPDELREQPNDWRRQVREDKLTVPQTLQEEGISSIRCCMFGCIIYLSHILNPVFKEPRSPEVTAAIAEILEIAKETPEGYGLEMGLYFGLFMAGISVFNETPEEDLLKKKLKADTRVSIYHADRALELLEVLWGRQHRYGVKYDWRQVQIQMGIQVYIFT